MRPMSYRSFYRRPYHPMFVSPIMRRWYRPYRRPLWGFWWLLLPLGGLVLFGRMFWLMPIGLALLLVMFVVPGFLRQPNVDLTEEADPRKRKSPDYPYEPEGYDDAYQMNDDPTDPDGDYFQTVDGDQLHIIDDDGSGSRLTTG